MPSPLPDLIDRVVADCARRSGKDSTACRVIHARTVTWPDGSLGCPEPGRGYTMALVRGYWIVVEVDGVRFDYRANHLGHFRLCPHPGPLDLLPDDMTS